MHKRAFWHKEMIGPDSGSSASYGNSASSRWTKLVSKVALLGFSKRVTKGLYRPVESVTHWLDSVEQQQLRLELEAFASTNQKILGQSVSNQQGALSSRALGAGFEYAESRPYQAGDDIRFLDWRLLAKKQQPFTKWFEPERLETWCLVVDLNESMQFGTRKRLKIQQACRALGCLSFWVEQRQAQMQLIKRTRIAHQSQVSQTPMWQGRTLFDQSLAWVTPVERPSKALKAPNLSENAGFMELLLAVPDSLPMRTKLVIISDCHGMQVNDPTVQNRLRYLAQRFALTVVFIEDWAERHLPQGQALQLEALSGDGTMNLSTQQALSYQQWAQGALNAQQAFLQACGVNVVVWRADAPVTELFASLQTQVGG